jgi:hypothetical protein
MAIRKEGLKLLLQYRMLSEFETNQSRKLTARLSAARKVRARNAFIVAAARK